MPIFAMRNQVDCRWDVAALTSMAGFFAIATNRNIGWFYVAYMEEFGIDRRGASWPGSVLATTLRCVGLLLSVLQRYFSLFWIGLLGSILLWSSLIASSFVPNIEWMTAIIGVAHGMGAGLVLNSHLVLIMYYFRKYRGVAAGLRLSANPVSAIVFPVVLSALKDAYGFRGTLLVFSAITMHVTALSLMLKEPPWVRRTRTKKETPATGPTDIPNTLTYVGLECNKSAVDKEMEPLDASAVNQKFLEKSKEYELPVPEAEALLAHLNQLKSNESSSKTSPGLERYSALLISEIDEHGDKATTEVAVKKLDCYVPLLDTDKQVLDKLNSEVTNGDHKTQRLAQEIGRRISAVSPVTIQPTQSNRKSGGSNQAAEKGANGRHGTQNWVTRNRLSCFSSRSLRRFFKHVLPTRPPSLGLITAVVAATLLDYINAVHLSTMVDYARDKGNPPTQATMTIAYAAAPEIFGRIFLPFMADLGWVTRPTLACGSLFALGLLFAATPETTAAAHIVLRALSSVAMAGLLTMKQVLIADNLGAEAVPLVSGASGLLLVPVLFSNPMIIGYFRDTMGSYDNLFRIAAGVILCSAFVFAGIIVAARRTKAAATAAAAKGDAGCAA
ncbi:uncharacterized protein LOC119441734 [Dermacentor silvarum]|uniref:uncharacterized protein LOC119441734 n=1 Tax=Dermacentor silvarum TaxID=543639 RepID=UPI0018975CFB|nr:uncharacterized protein LOC119441734 [Dermacentor silvarum]